MTSSSFNSMSEFNRSYCKHTEFNITDKMFSVRLTFTFSFNHQHHYETSKYGFIVTD